MEPVSLSKSEVFLHQTAAVNHILYHITPWVASRKLLPRGTVFRTLYSTSLMDVLVKAVVATPTLLMPLCPLQEQQPHTTYKLLDIS